MIGLEVKDGVISKKLFCKVLRKGNLVAEELKISTLKLFKEYVKEVKKGQECGIQIEDFEDFEVGDVIVAYEVKENAKKFKPERVEIQAYEVKDK